MPNLSTMDLERAFKEFDKDGNGKLCRKEISNLLRSIGISPTQNEIDNYLSRMDVDGSGYITMEEFIGCMMNPIQKELTIEELENQFRFFDMDNDGFITVVELEKILSKANISDKTRVREMFIVADGDFDGKISLEEFIKLMKSNQH